MKQLKFVVVSVDGTFLQVQVTPAVKLTDFAQLFAEIRHVADTHRVKNILIDAHAFKKRISVAHRIQVALALVDKFLGCRVAGVISAESFDPQLLAETMARNRGGNVKMTTSLSEARQWLGLPASENRLPLAGVQRAS